MRHDESDFVLIANRNSLVGSKKHRVNQAQFIQTIILFCLDGQGDNIALYGICFVGTDNATLGITHGNAVSHGSHVCRLVDDLVDIHGQAIAVVNEKRVTTRGQRGVDADGAPFIFRGLLAAHGLLLTVYDDGDVAALCGTGIAHDDVVITLLSVLQVEVVAQRAIAVGAHIHETITGVPSDIWIVAVKISDISIDGAEVHVFGLDDDGTSVKNWLFG